MNAPARLGGFAVAAVAVFGAAFGAGKVVDPEPRQPVAVEHGHPGTASSGPPSQAPGQSGGPNDGHGDHSDPPAATERRPGGLLVADQGYTFVPGAVADGQFTFRILDREAHAVKAFDVVHDKPMHLIVVRRDLSGFRHIHPQLDADGTWRVPLRLDEPGVWRAFADFTPTGGPALTLGADLHVAGDYQPTPLPGAGRTATVEDYTVELSGELQPGRTTTLRLKVGKGGQPVTDLQPYLGALGHLVALRQDDLAYLHVHPTDGLTFEVEAPTAGTYRLFLDFQHGNVVRTAAFTVVVKGGDHAHN